MYSSRFGACRTERGPDADVASGSFCRGEWLRPSERESEIDNAIRYGRFLQIERPRIVEYTWMSEATKGAESVVTVTMEARGEQTEVTLRHSGVPDDEMGRQHKEGWTWVLSALADALAARRSASSSD